MTYNVWYERRHVSDGNSFKLQKFLVGNCKVRIYSVLPERHRRWCTMCRISDEFGSREREDSEETDRTKNMNIFKHI